MFPLYSEHELSRTPFATYLLIAANIAMFLHQILPGAFNQSIFTYGVIPAAVFHPGADPFRSPIPVPLTFLTAMFSHGGWIHLLSNMMYLWAFGRDVEEDFGFFRFLWFYLLTGIISTLVFVFAFPASTVPLVGASGAISGILGAYFLRFPGRKIHTLFFFIIFFRILPVPAFVLLGYWALIQFLSCAANCTAGAAGEGGVAWLAHIGGFVAGMVWTILILRKRYYQRKFGY